MADAGPMFFFQFQGALDETIQFFPGTIFYCSQMP